MIYNFIMTSNTLGYLPKFSAYLRYYISIRFYFYFKFYKLFEFNFSTQFSITQHFLIYHIAIIDLSNSADIEKFSFELPYVKPNLSTNSSLEDDSSTGKVYCILIIKNFIQLLTEFLNHIA